MPTDWTFTTHGAAETQALAAHLGAQLQAGDVLWLSGDLGAGKTTFTQGLGRGLQIAAPINSPTFVLMREYHGRLLLYHIDLYRLDAARDIDNLGLRDYLEGDGVCVLEWAERFDAHETQAGLHLHIEILAAHSRAFHCAAVGTRAEQLLRQVISKQ
jgi:tRNA threonylcarbamoyladenosine biosynthesis protein TsaE